MNSLIPMTRMLDAMVHSPVNHWNDKDSLYCGAARADILESDQEYRLQIDLPGIRNEDVEINLENQTLQVKAERKVQLPEDFQVRRRERLHRTSFHRNFKLGQSVDAESISARLEDGVLEITLPKSEQMVPRRIEIK